MKKYIWAVVLVVLGMFLTAYTFEEERMNKKDINIETGNRIGGIVFFQTQRLEILKDFYVNRVGCELWLDQGACLIFKHGNFLLGFCLGDEANTEGTLTFFYENKKEVDRMFQKIKEITVSPPKENKKYRIYHFYAHDPEGRSIEFQHFLHPVDWDFHTQKK